MRRLLIGLLCLAGCMEVPTGSSTSTEVFRAVESESQVQASTEGYGGSGKIIATSVFRSPRTNAHWLLSGRLSQDDSRLSLYLFFDSFNHNTGLEIQIHRQGKDLELSLVEPGRPLKALSVIPEALDSEDRFQVRIETHNALHNHRRILVWNDWSFWGEGTLRTSEVITASNSTYDSQSSGETFYNWGSGIHWGLELFKVQELSIKREAVYVSH